MASINQQQQSHIVLTKYRRPKSQKVGNFEMVIKANILRGEQCIVLRGHREDMWQFLLNLKLKLSETNSELKHHLDAPSTKNTTYISPLTENELIQIISYIFSLVKSLDTKTLS